MRKQMWVIVGLVLGLVVYTYGAEQPVENKQLATLKAAYAAQAKSAVQPLQEKYAKQLDELLRQQGAAGQLEMAGMVKAELDSVAADMAADKVPTKVSTAAASMKLKIISAKYGIDGRWNDALAYVNERCASTNVITFDEVSANRQCGDPAPYKDKSLVIVYEYKGKQCRKTFMQGRATTLD